MENLLAACDRLQGPLRGRSMNLVDCSSGRALDREMSSAEVPKERPERWGRLPERDTEEWG